MDYIIRSSLQSKGNKLMEKYKLTYSVKDYT